MVSVALKPEWLVRSLLSTFVLVSDGLERWQRLQRCWVLSGGLSQSALEMDLHIEVKAPEMGCKSTGPEALSLHSCQWCCVSK